MERKLSLKTNLFRKLSRLGVAAVTIISLGVVGVAPAFANSSELEATTTIGQPSELKVVSYNIFREGTANGVTQVDPNHPWYKDGVTDVQELRRYKVIKYIQHSGASVVNLQEAEYLAQRADIKNSISLRDNWSMIEHNTDADRAWQQRPTIMHDTTKVENDRAESGVRKIGTNGLGNPMFLQWARFKDKKSQAYFYVFNTHFSSNVGTSTDEDNARRDSEMAFVVNRINEIVVDPNEPVILSGDFNSSDNSAAMVRAENAGLRDAHNVPGIPINGQGISTHPSFAAPQPGRRLDRVFFKDNSRMAITSYTTDTSEWLGSDHIPIYATFTLNPQ